MSAAPTLRFVDLLSPDAGRSEFRHSHPSATGQRRAAGVETRLPDHHATAGQRGAGKTRPFLPRVHLGVSETVLSSFIVSLTDMLQCCHRQTLLLSIVSRSE